MSANLLLANHNSYLNYFGLKSNPFPLVPDVNNFFFSEQANIILNEILHGIHVRKGFLLLTGEVGLGKTTIVHKLLNQLSKERVATAFIFNTFGNDKDFVDKILKDFGIEYSASTLAEKIDQLHEFLLRRNIQQTNCVIFIDDAQNLSLENIEILRMISNLETSTHKLVQIVLVGQPELKEKFESYELRQLKSRIMLDVQMKPLSNKDLQNYLIYKSSVHRQRLVFADESVSAIYDLTKGNLRKINKLLDRCLYAAIANKTYIINTHILLMAARDLDFSCLLCLFKSKYKLLTLMFIACVTFFSIVWMV